MTRKRLRIDLETFCDIDLRDTSVYRYVDDPSFEIMFAWWGYSRDDIRLALGVDEILAIPGLWDPEVVKVAHNAGFERVCLSAFRGLPVGEYLPPVEWHDTMAVAAEYGYPQSLGELAVALGAEPKDSAGTRLINLFCKPDRKGHRVTPEERPEEWQQFLKYGRQDVRTLFDVDETLGDFPTATERKVWLADQVINDRGVNVDLELASAAVDAAEDNRMVQELEIMSLTGVTNPGSHVQMLDWFRASGLKVTNLQAATVETLLAGDTLGKKQRRVLELRQELALVAAKKYSAAILGANSDGRLRGQFRFFGAHTGRWAGRGVQLHNLPRAGITLDPERLEEIQTHIRSKEARDRIIAREVEAATGVAILDLKLGNGADAHTLKALVRPMLVGPFTVSDYSAIEARVLAWLAGEEWVLEAFRELRDLYVEIAERMSDEHHVYSRSDGKIAVLALGYNGSVNALRHMGATGTDAELQAIVDRWRAANKRIVAFWKRIGEAFYKGGAVGEFLTVEVDGSTRAIRLPSGRAIYYHQCEFKWEEGQYGSRLAMSFADPKKRGLQSRTYGGKLAENVTQAVARDLLAEALVRTAVDGSLPIVGHVHDEILSEFASTAPHEGHSVRALSNAMSAAPAWAVGLPVSAEGYTCARYKKG